MKGFQDLLIQSPPDRNRTICQESNLSEQELLLLHSMSIFL